MNNLKILLLTLTVSLTITSIITWFAPNEALHKIVSTVIFDGIGIMAGLQAATIGLLLGSMSQMTIKIVEMNKNKILSSSDVSSIHTALIKLRAELKDNLIFCVLSYSFCVVLLILNETDIPYLHWPIDVSCFTKTRAVDVLILSLFGLIIYSLWDVITACFKISEDFMLEESTDETP